MGPTPDPNHDEREVALSSAARTQALTASLVRRGRVAFRLGALVLLATTAIYYGAGCLTGMNAGYDKSLWSLDDDRWQVTECLYAASITLTTIGYTDLLGTERLQQEIDGNGRHRWISNTDGHAEPGFDEASARLLFDWSPWTRALTSLLAIVGMAFFLYVVAQITTFFVEGGYEELRDAARSRRQIAKLRDHVILCGADESAQHALQRLEAEGIPCVVVAEQGAAAREVRGDASALVVRGDATEEETLLLAGIAHARGLVCALPEDGLNLVAVVTARQLRAEVRVISRALDGTTAERLRAAGADAVVDTPFLAGMRVASELVRPTVVEFLDDILGHRHGNRLRIEEAHCAAAGVSVGTVRERTGFVVLAVRRGAGLMSYNPSDATALLPGDQVAALGEAEAAEALQALLSAGEEAAARARKPFQSAAFLVSSPMSSRGEGATTAVASVADHYILCGCGSLGMHVARELLVTGRRVVAIERDPVRLRAARESLPELPLVPGDAQDPRVLATAGAARAKALATTLYDDRANVVIAVSARQANAHIAVLSVARTARAAARLERLGARVVLPGKIGGGRLAVAVLRPAVTTLLDRMLFAPEVIRFEAVHVRADAAGCGRTLAELDLPARTGLRALALRPAPGAAFVGLPGPQTLLEAGACVVVAGTPAQVAAVAQQIGVRE